MAEPEPRSEPARRFEYSPENPPPLDVLESKMFVVHSTPILPKGGVMIAGARDISFNPREEEPASFRPTIHFSLGEIVQEHRNFSWDENPYAIVAPLKAVKGQLMNLYPNDTFILGNYRLTYDATVLVPKGTNTSDLPPDVKVVEYNRRGQTGLRAAVNKAIADQQGWAVRMQPGGVDTGSVAMIEDVDINHVDFFRAMYEALPHVSYGTHTTSERGEAFRLGSIEQATNWALQGYKEFGRPRNLLETQFYKAYIEHNLARLTDFLKGQNLSPEAIRSFEEKSVKLRGWLNIMDVDLEIREKYGRTLNHPDKQLADVLRANRNDIDELRQVTDAVLEDLPSQDYSEPSASIIAEAMVSMPVEEMREFVEKNAHIFRAIDMPMFYTQYAIKRWFIERDEVAHEHSIDTLLTESLPQLIGRDFDHWHEPIFRNLEVHLSAGSNRLPTALNILRLPVVKNYLRENVGVTFAEGEPKTLDAVLRAHPETSLFFNPPQTNLDEQQKIAYEFLIAAGYVGKSRQPKSLDDFRSVSSAASGLEWERRRLVENLGTMTKPMSDTRNLADVLPGDTLSLYEQMRRDQNPSKMWGKMRLDSQYRKYFPHDSMFWNSDNSLLEIYKLLKAK